MPVLYVKKTKKKLQFKDWASIGRSSRCTLCIKDIRLSRVHCEIIQCEVAKENKFILIDLHSQNGTSLNGRLISETFLKNEDVILIGETEIVFYQSSQEPIEEINSKSNLPKYTPMAIKKVGPKDISK